MASEIENSNVAYHVRNFKLYVMADRVEEVQPIE